MSKKDISGIYVIINKTNEKKYIGSSKHVYYRWKQDHLPLLKSGMHYNRHLQSAWNKSGEDAFEFQVVEECEEANLLDREGHYIEHYQSWEREHGYNFTRIVDGKLVFSAETRSAMCQSNLARRDKDFWTTGVNAQILEMFKAGKSKNSIAKELGISRSAVYSCLAANALHEVDHERGKTKLTDEVKAEVQRLRGEGNSWDKISEMIGVGKTQLFRSGIAEGDGKYAGEKRETYRTVTPEVIEKVRGLRESTSMTWNQIAKEVGVSRFALYENKIPEQFEKRKKSWVRKKLTDEIKTNIAQLATQGQNPHQIAELTGISESTVRYCLQRYIHAN